MPFELTIEPVANDGGASDPNPSTVRIDENITSGTRVAKLTGFDGSGPYTIQAVNNLGGRYAIEHDIVNHVWYVVVGPNGGPNYFDVEDSFYNGIHSALSFRFMQGSTVMHQVELNVRLNDLPADPPANNPPSNVRFSNDGPGTQEISIDENTNAVGTVISNDTGPVTYSFETGGNGGGRFSIDAATGVITALNKGVDYESMGPNKYFDLVVLASDGINPATRQVLRVNINDANDAPSGVWLNSVDNNRITVQEQLSIGTPIATLVAVDADGSREDWGVPSVTFSIKDSPEAAFYQIINTGTEEAPVWRLAIKSTIRYEDLPTGKNHVIEIVGTDGAGKAFTQGMLITFTSLDDPGNRAPENPVVLGATGRITEDVPGSDTSVVARVQSTDQDGDLVLYSFLDDGNPGGLFAIDFDGVITFTGDGQDFEDNDLLDSDDHGKFFRLWVQASDLSLTSGPTEVKVYIDNVNEAPEALAYTSVSEEPILETAMVNTVVGTLSASDPDGTMPGFVFVYEDGTTSTISEDGAFKIVLVGGVYQVQVADSRFIQVASPNGTFEYNVKATDGSLESEIITISIIVDDVPRENQKPVVDDTEEQVNVDDNAGAVKPFGDITIVDDWTQTFTVTVTLSGGSGTLGFTPGVGSFNGQTRTYTVSGTLDYVQSALRALTFNPDDDPDGEVGATSDTTFTVKISDGDLDAEEISTVVRSTVANRAPTGVTIDNAGSVTVVENGDADRSIGTLRGVDSNLNDTFTYEIFEPTGMFAISDNQLHVVGTLDYEAGGYEEDDIGRYYVVQVQARDRGGALSSPVDLKVYIQDVNEEPTDISLSNDTISVDAGGGDVVGQLGFVDPDTGAMGTFTITVNPNDYFQIETVDGVVQLQVHEDAELAAGDYDVTIRVTDEHGLHYDETFTITVTPGNAAPVITGVPTGVQTVRDSGAVVQPFDAVSISDGGILVVTVEMDDPAKGTFTGGVRTFRIEGTASEVTAALQVLQFDPRDKATGSAAELTTFTITVTDGQNATATASVQVSATANRAPTGITLSNLTVQELAASGSSVATLSATDADGDTLTYKIKLANGALVDSDGYFTVSGGKLVVANGALFDAEQAATRPITLQVSDNRGGTATQTFTINISDKSAEVMTPADASPFNDIIKGSRTGNFRDVFFGGAGDDKLWGGYGNDTLSGGTGKDIFVFDGRLGTAATDRKVNYDTIKDYSVKDDSIWLDNDLFKANKKLYAAIKKGTETKPLAMASKFFTVGDEAKDADEYVVYDARKRVLSYDADGNGAKAAIEIATFTNNKALKGFGYKEFFFI